MKSNSLILLLSISILLTLSNLAFCQIGFKGTLKLLDYSQPGGSVELSNGDIILQGGTNLAVGYSKEFFCRIDTLGNVIWCHQFLDSTNFYLKNGYMHLDSSGIVHSIGTWCNDFDQNGIIIRRKIASTPISAVAPSKNGYKFLADDLIFDMDSQFNFSQTGKKLRIDSVPLNQYRETGMQQTQDSGYIYYGRFIKTQNQIKENDFFIIKMDSAMNTKWYKIYQPSDPVDSLFIFSDLIQTSTGEFIATFSPEILNRKTYVLKLDATGNFIWGKKLSLKCWYLHIVEQKLTGNYIFSMNLMDTLTSNQESLHIIKTDTAFNILSNLSYNESSSDRYGQVYSELSTLRNNQFILKTIKYYGIPSESRIYLLRTDSSFQNSCRGIQNSLSSIPYFVTQTLDSVIQSVVPYTISSFFATTQSVSNASNLDLCSTTGINNSIDSNSITIFPNPTAKLITINFKNMNYKQINISISDLFGKSISLKSIINLIDSYSLDIDLSQYSPGIYLLNLIADGEKIVKLIVKE